MTAENLSIDFSQEKHQVQGPIVVECGELRIESPGGSGSATKVFIDGVEQHRLVNLVLRICVDECTTLEMVRFVMPKDEKQFHKGVLIAGRTLTAMG